MQNKSSVIKPTHEQSRAAVKYLGRIRNPWKRTYGVKYWTWLTTEDGVLPDSDESQHQVYGSTSGQIAPVRYFSLSSKQRGRLNSQLNPSKQSHAMKVNEQAYIELEREVTRLLKSLKPQIADDYRANEEDDCPGMQVTIGATPKDENTLDWDYQTGDNSYSGGAYGHHNWGVIYLYRRSNCAQLAKDCVSEIADSISQIEAV